MISPVKSHHGCDLQLVFPEWVFVKISLGKKHFKDTLSVVRCPRSPTRHKDNISNMLTYVHRNALICITRASFVIKLSTTKIVISYNNRAKEFITGMFSI